MTLTLIAAAVALLFGCAGPMLVVSNFKSDYQPRTRTVAIAPLANHSNRDEGAAAARTIREAMYRELTKHPDKYTVVVQDIAETDRRILASGLSDSSLSDLSGIDLCKMFGADAVMKGAVTRYEKYVTGSDFANAASALFHTVDSEVTVDLPIFDGTDGKPVFHYLFTADGDLVNERDKMLNKLGSQLAKQFPYRE